MEQRLRIEGSGAVCAVGLNVAQIWAAVRARISRSQQCGLLHTNGEPLVAAWLPDEVLAELPPPVLQSAFTQRQLRMIQLAVPAITQALDGQVTPLPVFVGLPEPHPRLVAPAFAPSEWMKALGFCLGPNQINISQSAAFPLGRASAFAALEASMKYLASAPGRSVLVGAVDTFWDVPLLAQLMKEERILAEGVSDGFIPGEGAAFIVLTSRPKGNQEPATLISSTGVALDPGHRYSDQPAKGEGLSLALDKLRNTFAPTAAANFVLAGYNGERFDSKQWGVAAIRHRDLFAEDHMFEHPADCFGDLGAASGAMLLVLANAALVLGHRESPALVWAGSDLGTYGATRLELIS